MRAGIVGRRAASRWTRERLAEHLAHRHARVERAVGVLEDHLDPAVEGAAFGAGAARRRPCLRSGCGPRRARAAARGSGRASTSRSRTRRRCRASRRGAPRASTPFSAWTAGGALAGERAPERLRLTGKRLDSALDRDQRFAAHHAAAAMAATSVVVEAGDLPCPARRLRAAGHVARQTVGREGAARMEGAAGGQRGQARRRALDRRCSMRALGARRAGPSRAGRAYRDGAARRRPRRRCRSRRCGRHTSPPCGRRSPRRRRGRG